MKADDTAGQARKGLFDSVTGKAKEMFGAISGNSSLTSEGQLQQRQAQDRKEANSTQSLADVQADEAAQDLAQARNEGAQRRTDAERQAAGRTSEVRAAQQAEREQAEQRQRQETSAGQAGEQFHADAQVRAAAAERVDKEASATRDAEQAAGKHERVEADADHAEAQAVQARREAEKLTRKEGLE